MCKYAETEHRTTTQQKHPWRATARTLFAYLVAILAAMAVGLPIIEDGLGVYLSDRVKGALTILASLAGSLLAVGTRLMALPAVDDLLDMIGLRSAPKESNIDAKVGE